jgi:cytochrome oxidase assembly protein ShyY1
MARWPDSARSNVTAALIMFVGLPVLCYLAWWYVKR